MNIIKKMTIAGFFIILLDTPIIFAAPLPFFLSIDPALVLTSPGITQDINFTDTLGNTYINKTKGIKKDSLSVAAGVRFYSNRHWQLSTGIRYLPVNRFVLEGQIWQLKSPLFDELGYTLQVKSNLLLIDNIISWTQYAIQPGIILGLGHSYNTTDKFFEVALAESAAPSLQTANGFRKSQCAYELGAVLDYSRENAVIELAYRYINAGTGQLQAFSLQNTRDRFSTGTLYYHMISVGIRAYYEF